MPAPAISVSLACSSGLSLGSTAAATPPCAQAEDEPSPKGAATSRVTGSGASFSAQKSPASPPPTMRMSDLGMTPSRTAYLTAIIRSTERRARAASAGSMTTSSRM